jgi:ABC-type multidrug transport system fused ATPase/permease subunit
MFQGTIKFNVDPLNLYKEENIIQCMMSIGFEYILSEGEGLNKLIAEGGSNISIGERQLICIVRAMLRVALLNRRVK